MAHLNRIPFADADADADGQLHNFSDEEKKMKSSSVWDCGSSLYDSFELSAFSEQLNRTIAAEGLSASSIMKDGRPRSVSMPHYADSQVGVAQEDHPKSSKRFGIPKFVQRLFTKAFHPKATKSKKVGRTRSERMLYTSAY